MDDTPRKKRLRDDTTNNDLLLFPIHNNNSETHPATKRLCLRESLQRIPSPSNVAVDDTTMMMQMEIPWWKRQQQQQPCGSDESCCFVCRHPMGQPGVTATSTPLPPPQSNTLLAYFGTKTPLLRRRTSSTTTPPHHHHCGYCLRTNICAACYARCDGCGHFVCVFCREDGPMGCWCGACQQHVRSNDRDDEMMMMEEA